MSEPAAAPPAPSESAPAAVAAPAAAAVPPADPAAENAGLPEADARRIDLTWSGVMVALLALTFVAFSLVRGVGIPVFVALALAYGLNPVVNRLAQGGVKRTLATVIVFIGLAVVVVGFFLWVIPVFGEQAAKLPEFFKAASVKVVPWVESTFGISVPELISQRTSELGNQASALLSDNAPSAAKLLSKVASNTASVATFVIAVLVIPVLGFFFLADFPKLLEIFKRLIPRRAVGLVGRRFSEIDEVLSAFVRGQLIVGGILSILYSVGLSIARIEMAVLIGLIAGFGNMVPYVGTSVGVALAMVGLALSWQAKWQLVVVACTFAGAQLLEALVITPRIVGEKVGLPPVAVIIAVLAFAELFGFVGVLLAVPSTAVLKVVAKVVLMRYRRTGLYLGGPAAS